ncbi:hypothetical protein [Lactococcus cremoris]|uniref:Uncharacterized protein n=1 Tax=Lactococcus lactis subsp. cremoris (strain MG1363) TaxID=416870 RepID=A2RM65_LACLM|nr:hypothetical protein [Lactococcus cremoris]ADJ60801.1 hypothetical protein LLNZ_09375 [Lactococcus cremoris subsp. cremoris NZ9000]KZK51237.1 flotillin-like protein [Lactococcus cremoris]MCT4435812.1 hypothetical protein [Lactococcus cremoris]MCT4446535.1 hypothetical protein [Lactococcus cremoris]MCZ7689238.1 hypothetical protein [Lactococcus cremoris]
MNDAAKLIITLEIFGMSQESLKQGLDVLGTMGIDVPNLLNNFSNRVTSSEKLETVEKINE